MVSSVRGVGVVKPTRLRAVELMAGMCLVAGAMALAGAIAAERSPGIALARALMVGVPAGVGLWVWASRRERRFGVLLVAAGSGWFLTTFAESRDPVAFTAGRVAGWLVEVLLVYLFLAFPDGGLRTRIDRMLVAAMGLAVAVLLGPQTLLAERFEVPSPYASCVDDCPSNALFAVDRQPAFVDAVLQPVAVVVLVVVLAAVVVRLLERTRTATPTSRLILAPVLAVAVVRVALLGTLLVGREIDSTAWPVEIVSWMLALAVPLVAVAFLAGLLRWKLFAGRALQQLADCIGALPSTPMLRRAFADALDDSTIDIVFPSKRSETGWVDESGTPVAASRHDGLCLTEVHDGRTLVAGIIHDRALRDDPQLLDATVAMAGVVLENKRLAAAAEDAMAQVRESRARIAATAERERRRIERDLHDGAQQRLVALRIELGLAGDLVRQDPLQGAVRLCELEHAVDDALEELRALAHGVYPALLSSGGVAEALASVADDLPLPVELRAERIRRHTPEVESAVYFCVVESLQNVLKHAGDVRQVVVELAYDEAGALRFAVTDDGHGLPPRGASAGAGLTNMRDRLAAVGGEVVIGAAPERGVRVRGRVPPPSTAATAAA